MPRKPKKTHSSKRKLYIKKAVKKNSASVTGEE